MKTDGSVPKPAALHEAARSEHNFVIRVAEKERAMDTLRARIVQLEQENAALRALLKKHGIVYPEAAENQISTAAN